MLIYVIATWVYKEMHGGKGIASPTIRAENVICSNDSTQLSPPHKLRMFPCDPGNRMGYKLYHIFKFIVVFDKQTNLQMNWVFIYDLFVGQE